MRKYLNQLLLIIAIFFATLGHCDVKYSDLTSLQCALISNWVFFDLRDLETSGDSSDQTYTVTSTNSTGTMTTTFTYQFCAYTQLSSPETFAYMDQTFLSEDGTTSATSRIILTNDDYSPYDYYAVIEEDERVSDGISITHQSASACTADQDYQLVTNVMCNDTITSTGGAIVTNVVFDESATTGVASDDPCVVTMTFKHDGGCPFLDLYRVKLLFKNNEWVVGIILILAGSFMGLFGLKFLRTTAAIMVSISIIIATLILSNIFGFFDTILGIIITCTVAFVVSIVCGVLTVFFVWVAIGLLGILGGFFLGSLIYETTIMQFDFSHVWGFLCLTVTGVVLGLFLSVKYGKQVILFSTSLVGAYFMMQGTSRFFPNQFPTEMQVVDAIQTNEKDFEIDWRFWLYIVEWVTFFILFTLFQWFKQLNRPISAKETVNTSLN